MKNKYLKKLDAINKKLLNLSLQMLRADEGNFYPLDIYANGIIKRALSINKGFTILIKEKNYLCSGALLRMQIDNCIRFYAAFIVNNPHEFAKQVFSGKYVKKIKDKDGKFMTDHYLVNKLSKKYQWLSKVYESTSGFIHFSDRHMKSIFSGFEEDRMIGNINISPEDDNLPEYIWDELIDAYLASIEILFEYLQGWIFTKNSRN